MRLPSPIDQLTFLAKIERIFSEGDFTATYKCALMIALSELAVEHGFDDGDALLLRDEWIADRFIEMYWQQATPYRAGRGAAIVLSQNLGTQAAVITAIVQFRTVTSAATATQAAAATGYRRLQRRVRDIVRAQPVQYLQNFGGKTDRFLFDVVRGGLMLKPGVAFNLRRFQRLIQQLARAKWIEHLSSNHRNAAALGDAVGLESFLFDASRRSLTTMASGLRKLFGAKCFYCGRTADRADVDHFIPFSLYPRDLAANFVLAHPACNSSKSDTLAARAHLERWIALGVDSADQIAEIGQVAGFEGNATTSAAVARWAYENAVTSQSMAWVSKRKYEAIDDSYLGCFGS